MRSGGTAPTFLTSALDGVEWLASLSRPLYSWERSSGTHWVGGWVGLRAYQYVAEKRKMLLLPGIEPCRPARRCFDTYKLNVEVWVDEQWTSERWLSPSRQNITLGGKCQSRLLLTHARHSSALATCLQMCNCFCSINSANPLKPSGHCKYRLP
jgi:hypothetical protein